MNLQNKIKELLKKYYGVDTQYLTGDEVVGELAKLINYNTNNNENCKFFRLNVNGVTEWIVARSKKKALEHAKEIWGEDVVDEEWLQYKKYNPQATFEDFVEYFVKVQPDREFYTECTECGKMKKTTVQAIINSVVKVPCWVRYQE